MEPTTIDWTDPDIDVDWEVEHGDLDAGGGDPVTDAYRLYMHLPPSHPIRWKVSEHFPDDPETEDEYDQMVQWAVHYTLCAIEPTDFTIRQATAFVLSQSPDLTWDEGGEMLDVSPGTFRSKVSREVEGKLNTAQATVDFAEGLKRSWAGYESYTDHIENEDAS